MLQVRLMLHSSPLSPQFHMPYRWTGFTTLPLLVTYGDSAGASETGRSAASSDADKGWLDCNGSSS